jgi:hypothetical protein
MICSSYYLMLNALVITYVTRKTLMLLGDTYWVGCSGDSGWGVKKNV